jgi:HAD superfamily hydrolase (TIGR01549 family)
MRFIDQFSVVLFDLHGTLMFEQDRFDPSQNYYATYQALGGTRLDARSVRTAIETCLRGLQRDYDSTDMFDDFPTLAEAFRRYTHVQDDDLPLLVAVYAEHERGRLSAAYVEFLMRLAESHQLGIVSNICAPPDTWIAAFERVRIRDVFEAMVFSSEGRSIKPSHRIFRRALSAFDRDARVLFVGDNVERDIRPAHALGLGTAWIAPPGSRDPAADVVVETALELEHLES